jgi:hypothetical protein
LTPARPVAAARVAPEPAAPRAPAPAVAPESVSAASVAAGASGGAPAGVGAGPRAAAGDVLARRAPAGTGVSEEPPARPIAALPTAGAAVSTGVPDPSAAPASGSGSSGGAIPAPARDTSEPRVAARAAEVSVVKTVWHPSAARRVAHVTVAGQDGSLEVREGDLVEGLEVREIKLSGVVFERAGVEIERRVQARR